MHVPAGHSFPDATGVAFALGLGPPSLFAAVFIIRAQARKAQGPIDFVRILFFFLTIQAFLGGLTWSKTLENLHTHWNLWPLGRRRGWDPGVAQRLYGAPWNTIIKLDV